MAREEKNKAFQNGLFLGFAFGLVFGFLIGFVVSAHSVNQKRDREIFQDHVTNYGCVAKVEEGNFVCYEASGRKFVLPQ